MLAVICAHFLGSQLMRFPRAGAVRAGKCDLLCRQRMNALSRVLRSADGCLHGSRRGCPRDGCPVLPGCSLIARDLSAHLSSPSLFPNVQLVICMRITEGAREREMSTRVKKIYKNINLFWCKCCFSYPCFSQRPWDGRREAVV